MKRIEITWLILLMICVSCASNKTLEPQIKPLTIEKPSSSQAVSDFTLGPGDVISINVWRNPDLSRKIKINKFAFGRGNQYRQYDGLGSD